MNLNENAIRSNRPLTLDQIRRVAPSAFASSAYHRVSSRYTYIPTSDVIEGMMKAGFQAFPAAQSTTRLADKREHAKHMIRFRTENQALALNETFPEIALINSHDGSSAYKLMAGLFRLVCSNGMVVADSLIGSLNARHTGKVIEEVATGSVEIIQHIPVVVDAIERWKQIQLNEAEQTMFAEAAHHVKFAGTDGKITTPIKPSQMLNTRRSADTANDLWAVFNRIQENALQGGLSARPRSGRRVTTQAVRGIDQDVKLNRALWTLGEKMAALKAS